MVHFFHCHSNHKTALSIQSSSPNRVGVQSKKFKGKYTLPSIMKEKADPLVRTDLGTCNP